jgi:osmotically inducible protein OsmC
VTATITFDKIEAGWRIVSSALTVRGDVPGISADRFVELAEEAKVGCPISTALSDHIALTVAPTLAA